MRRTIGLLMVALLLFNCGCSQVLGHYAQKNLNMTEISKAKLAQQRTYRPFQVKGLKRLTMEAAEGQTLEITMESQLEALDVIPKNKSAIEALGDAAWRILTVLGATYLGLGMVDVMGDPHVERVEPLLVPYRK